MLGKKRVTTSVAKSVFLKNAFKQSADDLGTGHD